jgi:hypothetical protein
MGVMGRLRRRIDVALSRVIQPVRAGRRPSKGV